MENKIMEHGNKNLLDQEQKDLLEQLHNRMIEEVQDYAIILLDAAGNILTWNKGVERIKGYKPDEIIGQDFNIFYLPRDRQEGLHQKLIDQAKKKEGPNILVSV